MKCANCSKDAAYTYRLNEDSLIHYCYAHLPKFLKNLRNNESLKLYVPPTKTTKKTTTVVEEPAPTEE